MLAESLIYDYSLVADAKAFRMSRTAKNQKDFKVVALSGWRKDADYAVLCSPYFQYPLNNSQIYSQALENNVCLLSWEHLVFLISNGIKENYDMSFSPIWNCSHEISQRTFMSANKHCTIPDENLIVLQCIKAERSDFASSLIEQINMLKERSCVEKQYWKHEKEKIKMYTREQAINELISARKINEKLSTIDSYIGGLGLQWID